MSHVFDDSQTTQDQPWPLMAGRVQLWRIDTPLPSDAIAHLRTHLSDDELTRADKLSLPGQCERFIARRGLLRQILADVLATTADQITITYGQAGKPMLCPPQKLDAREYGSQEQETSAQDKHVVRFNLTHCRDVALLGVTLGDDIGVDLEAIDPKRDIHGIGQRFFHPKEWDHLRSLPQADQSRMFFDYWASKEAVVKAHGGGIMSGLNDCLIRPSAANPDLKTCDHFIQTSVTTVPWSIRTLQLADVHDQPYVAAVALPGDQWSLAPKILRAQPR